LLHGFRVLDVGTGTGVLAIAAVKLGARSAVGIDIDAWSIENARENVLLNRASGDVTIAETPIEHLSPDSFDLIAANLTLNTNIELLPLFAKRLDAHGYLILSGMLEADAGNMLSALESNRFRVVERADEHGWIAIVAQHS